MCTGVLAARERFVRAIQSRATWQGAAPVHPCCAFVIPPHPPRLLPCYTARALFLERAARGLAVQPACWGGYLQEKRREPDDRIRGPGSAGHQGCSLGARPAI